MAFPHPLLLLLGALLLDATSGSSQAQEAAAPKTAETIAKETRPSLVAITHHARPGRGDREGSGFFIEPGLIATNLHVIGEARPIHVVTSDGRELEVESIHASDRKLDLALLRVKERDVPHLPLGDSSDLPDGHPVVAMGNPQGFRFSVVEGIISATREIEGLSMIQLAIPIEPGNSGGPLLNREGEVIGIPSMKSQLTDNIGFAIPINALKLLLAKPNPIPIDRWVTVGQLSPHRWKPIQAGARWRQRAGTISVQGAGEGFGGRALCLYQTPPASLPYEVSVRIKLDDESGAAGLVFASDGASRHYGFYPSGGKIRLTHFAGPDVFSWNILADTPCEAYRPGDWNELRAVIDEETIVGYVNGEEIVRVAHSALRGGHVGLCKFRQTEATYQRFSLKVKDENAAERAPGLSDKLTKALDEWLNAAPASSQETFEEHPDAAAPLLQNRAHELERQASQLREMALRLHQQHVVKEMRALVNDKAPEDIDLFRASLLIAKLAQPELDDAVYERELDAMVEDIRRDLEAEASPTAILHQLSDYLFQQLGFHGSRLDYYSRENSYLSTVLEDREGIPITLSVLFMELSRRLGVEDVVGIPLPGHFVVQYRPDADDPASHPMIDVYEGGSTLTRIDAEKLVRETTGLALDESDLVPASKPAILVRMLRNLINIDLNSEDPTQALPELDLLLSISSGEASERLSRALLLYQSRQWDRAREDIEWILEHAPPGIHLDRVRELRRRIDSGFPR